ncbi:MAG: hypothetical protein M3N93_08540 [Acidobacteriota bacterium]|nr:hypothetical protein [Acidobacteriota bacterium]
MNGLSRAGAIVWLALPSFAIEPGPVPVDLARVKRIFVEPLTGGESADRMRDMIVAAIQNTKSFIVTDNQERADATLRGSSDDKVFTEEHSTSDSIGLHANTGSGSSSSSSMGGGVSSRSNIGAGVTDNESSHIQERRHEASASIRLVDPEGDIIWSTTQESAGGKFRGAMADVAEKIARQLSEDARKARNSH